MSQNHNAVQSLRKHFDNNDNIRKKKPRFSSTGMINNETIAEPAIVATILITLMEMLVGLSNDDDDDDDDIYDDDNVV